MRPENAVRLEFCGVPELRMDAPYASKRSHAHQSLTFGPLLLF